MGPYRFIMLPFLFFLGLLCHQLKLSCASEGAPVMQRQRTLGQPKGCPFSVMPRQVIKQSGQTFDVTVTLPVLKTLHCYKNPEDCLLTFQAKDGVTLASSGDLVLVSQTRNAEWAHTYTFSLPRQINLRVGKKREDKVFTIKMATDLCNCPRDVDLQVTLVQTRGRTSTSCKGEKVKVRT